MICPACATTVTTADLRIHETVGVCPACARSLVKDKRKLRLATAQDIRALTPGQIMDLRQARPSAWRNAVRARYKGIVGRRT